MKMKKIVPMIILLGLVLMIAGCSQAEQPIAEASAESASATPDGVETPTPTPAVIATPEPTQAFPYEKGGRTWYQLNINGGIVNTKNLPFSISGEKGAYMPLEDVLSYFGVPCAVNDNTRMAAGCVNGVKFQVQAKDYNLTVGKQTITSTVCPQYYGGCLYVPSFLFMELLDATVDFSADRVAATIVTDIKIDAASSGTDGITLPDNTFGDGSVKLRLKTGTQSACCKLFFADNVSTGEEVLVAFSDPDSTVTLHFEAGTYILKLAYGDTWLGNDMAFGESGSYSTSKAYTFESGGSYEIEESETSGDFSSDNLSGFTGS